MKKQFSPLLGAVLALLVTLGLTPTAAAQSGGRILFAGPVTVKDTSNTGKPTYTTTRQILSMDENGGNVVQLTDRSAGADFPKWSPDGRFILFYRNGYLWIMDAQGEANGGASFRVVPTTALGVGSDWSPEGNEIVYPSATDTSAFGGLWIVDVNPDTGEVGEPWLLWDQADEPAWSPDGGKIAFWSGSVKVLDLTTFQVISYPWSSRDPSWNLDGSRLTFSRVMTVTTTGRHHKTVTYNQYQIVITDPDLSNEQLAADLPDLTCEFPALSPDDSTLVFTVVDSSNGTQTHWIYKATIGGNTATLLHEGWAPDWSPAQ